MEELMNQAEHPVEETQPVEAAQEAPEESPQQEAQPESDRKQNLRALRKAKESAEYERDEMRRMIQDLKKSQEEKVQQAQAADEESDLRPDDIPEWRHVEKHIKKLENKLSQYEKQTALHTTESKLKAQYPDFDSVVSAENVQALRKNYPEIAATLNSSNDLYAKAVSAYTMIQRLGIAEEKTYAKDRDRALTNTNKPRPLASVTPQQGDSPLSRANAFAEGLTDELKEKLHKEMISAMKFR